jgi:hypothetical protein
LTTLSVFFFCFTFFFLVIQGILCVQLQRLISRGNWNPFNGLKYPNTSLNYIFIKCWRLFLLCPHWDLISMKYPNMFPYASVKDQTHDQMVKGPKYLPHVCVTWFFFCFTFNYNKIVSLFSICFQCLYKNHKPKIKLFSIRILWKQETNWKHGGCFINRSEIRKCFGPLVSWFDGVGLVPHRLEI